MHITFSFDRFARRSAEVMGSAQAFMVLCGVTLVWLVIGPFVRFSELWQITMTTALTILTQATAMLIQATTNRQERAMQIKLDHVILRLPQTDNQFMAAEAHPEQWLDWLQAENERLRNCPPV